MNTERIIQVLLHRTGPIQEANGVGGGGRGARILERGLTFGICCSYTGGHRDSNSLDLGCIVKKIKLLIRENIPQSYK